MKIRNVLLCLGGIYFFYFISVFLFLSTPVFREVVSFGEKNGHLQFRWGWSFFPGIIEMKGVNLEIEDSNVHTKIDLARARAHVREFNPFRQRLTLSSLRDPTENGQVSFSIHLRDENEKSQYDNEKAALTQKDTKESKVWTVEITGVDLRNIKSAHIGQWTFDGRAHVRGGFRLTPGVKAEVFPSTLHVESGKIDEFSDELHGTVFVSFKPFSVPDVDGSDVFRYLNAQASLEGTIRHLHFLNRFFASLPEVSFDQGAGHFSITGTVQDGILQRGSQFRFASDLVTLHAGRYQVSGKSELRWHTNHERTYEKPAPVAELQVDMKKASIIDTHHASDPLLARGSIKALAWSPDLDLVEAFRRLEMNVGFHFQQSIQEKNWTHLLPPSVRLRVGNFALSGNVSALSGFKKGEKHSTFLKDGRVNAEFNHVKVSARSLFSEKDGSYSFDSHIEPIDLDQSFVRLKALRLSGNQIAFSDPLVSDWAFTVKANETRFHLAAQRKSLDGNLEVWFKDSSPIMEWLHDRGKISGLVASLGTVSDIRVTGRLDAQPGFMQFSELDVSTASLIRGIGELRLESSKPSGAMLFSMGFLSIGLKLKNDQIDYSLFADRGWLWGELESQRRFSRVKIPAKWAL